MEYIIGLLLVFGLLKIGFEWSKEKSFGEVKRLKESNENLRTKYSELFWKKIHSSVKISSLEYKLSKKESELFEQIKILEEQCNNNLKLCDVIDELKSKKSKTVKRSGLYINKHDGKNGYYYEISFNGYSCVVTNAFAEVLIKESTEGSFGTYELLVNE